MEVQELEAGGAGLRFEDVNDGGDALLGNERCARAAELSLMVAGVDEQLGLSVAGMAGGVTAHQLVEGCLAGLVELIAALGIPRDAALVGGHDRDGSARYDESAEGFQGA
ncbi:hypothetical protein ACFV47_13795 [Streptomyces solisilvae]|uniref:hypothetical protein n=1 Tax=Streptomyces malaysiensis TaxID=92644 RepID=UPI0036AF906A